MRGVGVDLCDQGIITHLAQPRPGTPGASGSARGWRCKATSTAGSPMPGPPSHRPLATPRPSGPSACRSGCCPEEKEHATPPGRISYSVGPPLLKGAHGTSPCPAGRISCVSGLRPAVRVGAKGLGRDERHRDPDCGNSKLSKPDPGCLGYFPSPQILKEPKSLHQSPSGASGSDSRQSLSR